MKRAFGFMMALAMVMMLLAPSGAALASNGSAEIRVQFSYQGHGIAGAEFTLYRVGAGSTTNGVLAFEPVAPFTGVVKSFYNLSDAEFRALAASCNTLAVEQKLPGMGKLTTGADGLALFTGLPYGVYLLRQTSAANAASAFEDSVPFLVSVPVMNANGTAWVEQIEARPKTEPTPSPTPEPVPSPRTDPNSMNLTVRKVWEDAEDAEGLRPESITLYLFRKLRTEVTYPTEPMLTVQMTGNRDTWRFTFVGLAVHNNRGVQYDYLVREGSVNGYEVSYNDTNRVITNVHDTPTPDPNSTPTPTPEPTLSTEPPVFNFTLPPDVEGRVMEIDGVWYYIDENGIPLGIVPQTGDDSPVFLYAGAVLALLSVSVALALLLVRRRRKTMRAK